VLIGLVFINKEGKFNENTWLIDGYLFGGKGNLSIYIIENDGIRMMIDTSEKATVPKIIKKLKEFKIYPIHKIFLTHSHFDHIDGVHELKKLITETKIEVLASQNAVENLKNPDNINKVFEGETEPIEGVIPLRDNQIIDLNGLKLEVLNFFGHTMDSIALFDKKNRNIFTGDAIIDKSSIYYFQPTFMPPDFHEAELLKTFQKLRNMKDKLNSISLAHYGVWTDEDFNQIINNMEELHFATKDSIIKWYKENPSYNYLALKFHEKFIPKSKIIKKGFIGVLEQQMEWLVEGLKRSGFI
jgi:glyoxylase-like metal-dependent hydrolase (beta-lactamase superfamily II)